MKAAARKAAFVTCTGCTLPHAPPHAERVQNLSSWILMFAFFLAAFDAAFPDPNSAVLSGIPDIESSNWAEQWEAGL